jgi:hypothetical protein
MNDGRSDAERDRNRHNAEELRRMVRALTFYGLLAIVAGVGAWKTSGATRVVLAIVAIVLGLASLWITLFSVVIRFLVRRDRGPSS